jgi:hypothetical protein
MFKHSKAIIKYAWLLACVACFILPLLLTPVGDSDSLHWVHMAIEDMTFVMFILSFPCSVGFVLVAAIYFLMFSPYDMPIASYLLLWLGFFVTGYVQWFWVLPELRQKRQLITLGLTHSEERKAVKKRRRRKRAHRARFNSSPIPQLDAIGRTPLERVIGDR